MHLTYSENGKAEGRCGPGCGPGQVWVRAGSAGTLDFVTATGGQNENRSATLVTDLLGVVGTGVDPVTYRFSGGRSTN